MHKISICDAEKRLRDLVDEAERGEEIVITRGDGTAFRRVPLPKQTPRPTFGSAQKTKSG